MESTANVENTIDIHPLLQQRKSQRAYDPDKEVSDEALRSLFEAARSAPSAFNEQPWRFIYAKRGTAAFDKIYNILMPGNQPWAGNAGALILVIVKVNSSHNDSFNRHAYHDLGLAMGMLSVQATSLGLNLHQMGGFKQAEAQEVFGIPAGYEAVTVTSVGYLGSPDFLPDALRERENAPRVRKEISEFAFENGWKP